MLTILLLTLGDPDRLTGGNRYHRRVAELAPALDARIETVGLPDRPPGVAALRVPAAVSRARRTGADCVLLDSLAAAAAAPWLTVATPRPPLLAMLHQPPGGMDRGPVRSALLARADRLAYRRALRLFAASQSLADDLVSTGVAPRERILVVPPGRDPLPPDGEARTGTAELRRGRRCAVLCAANWMPRKGILDLLEAVAHLPAGAVTLHLAGDRHADARHAHRVHQRLRGADLHDRVVVHGAVPQPRLAALYAACDVFALPSLREPYGTVYGEAMAAGRPVVGWRAGNLPHLADDGVEGCVLPPGDVAALACALQRLADDGPLRRRMGAAARRRAATLPRWEETAALLIGGIREALGDRSG